MLAELAHMAVIRHGERLAYVGDDGRALTYADLDRRSDELAARLRGAGVRPGDVVALVLPTTVDYPVSYLAAAKCGAVTAGVNTRLPEAERQRLIELVQPRVVLTEDTLADPALVDGFSGFKASTTAGPSGAGAGDAIAIVFTSGTTGTPKGATFGARQLDAIRQIDVGEQWSRGGASLGGTSFAHLGFMTKFPGALQTGGTTYLLRRWTAADAIRLTAEHRLTTLSGVPTQLALMLADRSLDDADLSALRMVLIGGAPASPALVRQIRDRLGVPVCTRYSCTEAGIGCGTRPDDPPEDAEETVGRPQPGVEVHISDDGEVLFRSAAVMSGYWADEPATRDAFTDDGFVRTGDLGHVDDRGRLHLVGRRKEMYVRGGYNVFPVEVEAALSGAPGVRDVVVVPRSDDVMGEIGVAVVVANGAPPSLEQLRSYAERRVAKYKLPEALLVVDALPLTAGDKVDRKALAALVQEQAR